MTARAWIPYRHADLLLIRATTCPGEPKSLDDLDLFGKSAVQEGCAWLGRIWQREDVRDSVGLASPVLSRQIDKALTERTEAREVRRIVISLASYLARWQGRATPFGLFAGVAAACIGKGPVAHWGQQHRVIARPDAGWLSALVGRLERRPDLLERLPVVANNAAFVRGDRLVIPGQPSGNSPAKIAPLEVSVRHTRPVHTVLEAAQQPCRFADLVKRLSAEYPAVAPDRVRALLAELVDQRVLLTALRAPMTEPDPLSHVTAQLAAVGADDLSDMAGLRAQLLQIHDDLSHLDVAVTRSALGGRPSMASVAHRMRSIGEAAGPSLTVDVGLDCDIVAPEPVIREAESAASMLLRLTPYPFGYPHWKDYHVRFKNRYGTGAVIPVGELVQADTGLGVPAGFPGSPITSPGRVLTARDDAILALVQQAVRDGLDEIVLTDSVIRDLTVGEPSERLLPPRVELVFQIQAASPEAVASGDFRLLVTGTPRPASSMAGRFADLLPHAERTRLAATYDPPDSDRDTLAAQLSFPARRQHSENVTRTPQLLPAAISISEFCGSHQNVIALSDLAVSADARELYLVQLSTGKRVEPRVLHALEAGVLTPPLARFLAEVNGARCAVYTGFDWGAAASLPYLPRLRYRRTVLVPARWLLTAADLPAPGASMPGWESALEAWRHRLRVPANVVVCEGELRLPLNLDHHLHRGVLRARLGRARRVELREAPGFSHSGWPGRPHEFLLPLRLAEPRTAPAGRASPLCAVSRGTGHLPGSATVLHAQIPGHPDRQDEILTDHLPRLFDGWDPQPLWWYSRHREMTRPDSEQHLDLYLRLAAPGDYGDAAARIGWWTSGLRDGGLVPDLRLVTYYPETGRYGHGATMAAAEEVFAADSAAAIAQIVTAARSGTDAQALAVASLADLACSLAADLADGMRLLICTLPKEQGGQERALRDRALELVDPGGEWAALHALRGGKDVMAAWERRRLALAAYRTQLAEQRDPHSVLRSLLHMHHVRCLGVDPEQEGVSNRLARAAALRHLTRLARESQ